MDEVTTKVARQYTEHAYPKPTEDLVATPVRDLTDPAYYAPIYWPEGRSDLGLDILVAGCGTQQAAIIAHSNPDSRVVGVDLSEASLAHQRFLKAKHGLDNLRLYQGDLHKVGEIGQSFDLVISTGVLHHLADPSQGVRAVAATLKPGGALGLMMYGAGGRTGVYMLQDAFRRMGLGQSSDDIALVRRLLGGLPHHHPARAYVQGALELAHDTAVVDTFLHPQDRAYSVPQLLAWLDDNGLALQNWAQNQFYYPEAMIAEPGARAAIQALPPAEQWAVVENLIGSRGNHIFAARPKSEVHAIDFDGGLLAYRPSFRPEAGVAEVRPDGAGQVGMLAKRIELGVVDMTVARLIDGRRTLGDILAHEAFAASDRPSLERSAAASVQSLWKLGLLMLQL